MAKRDDKALCERIEDQIRIAAGEQASAESERAHHRVRRSLVCVTWRRRRRNSSRVIRVWRSSLRTRAWVITKE